MDGRAWDGNGVGETNIPRHCMETGVSCMVLLSFLLFFFFFLTLLVRKLWSVFGGMTMTERQGKEIILIKCIITMYLLHEGRQEERQEDVQRQKSR